MLNRLKAVTAALKREILVYQQVLSHPRTPRLARLLLGAAVGYALSPIDLIPDFIPVVGHLDDVLVVPALVALALRFIPKEVVEECRAKVKAETL